MNASDQELINTQAPQTPASKTNFVAYLSISLTVSGLKDMESVIFVPTFHVVSPSVIPDGSVFAVGILNNLSIRCPPTSSCGNGLN